MNEIPKEIQILESTEIEEQSRIQENQILETSKSITKLLLGVQELNEKQGMPGATNLRDFVILETWWRMKQHTGGFVVQFVICLLMWRLGNRLYWRAKKKLVINH